jgi:hypothetical protein
MLLLNFNINDQIVNFKLSVTLSIQNNSLLVAEHLL